MNGDVWANKFHVTNPLDAQTVLSNEINAATMTAGTLNVSNIVLNGKSMDVLDGTGVMGALNGIDVSFGAVDVSGGLHVSGGLNVNGDIVATGSVTVSGSILTSDDRLKHNEVMLTGATATLGKLKPQIYDKSRTFASRDDMVRESGLIAQDIWYDVPELRHLVNLAKDVVGEPQPLPAGTDRSDPQNDPDYTGLGWGGKARVNYVGLIAYLIQANQELSARLDRKFHDMDALKVEMARTMERVRAIEVAREDEKAMENAAAAKGISKDVPKELKSDNTTNPVAAKPAPAAATKHVIVDRTHEV